MNEWIPANPDSAFESAGMKAFIFLAMGCVAMLFGGCRTVAVVDHGRPVAVRSGYYHSRPTYYSSRRPYYYSTQRPYYSSRYNRSSRYDGDYGYRRSYYRDSSYPYRRPAGRGVVS